MGDVRLLQLFGVVNDIRRAGCKAQRTGNFRMSHRAGEEQHIGLRVELFNDLVDAFDEGTGHIEVRDAPFLVVLIHAFRDAVGA